MKKILACTLAAVAISGILGAVVVTAQAASADGNYPPIIQKLVERFGLAPEEVQEVLDEARQERRQAMQVRFEERLDKAVEEGKLTQEQKEVILAKKEEMREKREELSGLSPEERRERMKEMREEMRAQADENGIGLGLMSRPQRWGGFKGAGRGFGRGFRPAW